MITLKCLEILNQFIYIDLHDVASKYHLMHGLC